jgi:hypothetical protein
MKITRKQIRKIIAEVRMVKGGGMPMKSRANPEFAAIIKGQWRESIDPREPDYHQDHLKVGDLVRSVDYEGDGWGGDYERSVGDQVGTVVEVDVDPDGTQYTVYFPDGTTVMDTASEFDIIKEVYDNDADEWYEDRHAEDQNDMDYYTAVALEKAVKSNPGIDGAGLLDVVRQDPEYSSLFKGMPDGEIWEVADEMIEDETLFFDVEEDKWHYAPEMKGLAGETYEKTAEDYKKHPGWFN